MQLQEGQIIQAPFLSTTAEVKKFQAKTGYYLLEVVLQDGHHTYKPLRITEDQFAAIKIVESRRLTLSDNAEDFFFLVEANRIRLAYQFDPQLAVSVSQVDPLPHQIEAVYHYVLPLPRIRFLIADDTATPHRGDKENFRLFLDLLRPGFFAQTELLQESVQAKDNPIFVRRLKEDMRRFDGSAIFPPRHVQSVKFPLTDAEIDLYNGVTRYVQNYFDKAKENRSISFALMILQRRLTSSSHAIHRSLERRRDRLQELLALPDKIRSSQQDYLKAQRITAEELEDMADRDRADIEEQLEHLTIAQNIIFEKLDRMRLALGSDRVFDIIGEVIPGARLDELLKEAIFSQRRMEEIEDQIEAIDEASVRQTLEQVFVTSLATRHIDYSGLLRETLTAQENRLVPEYVEDYFLRAFRRLEGKVEKRQAGFAIPSVPFELRCWNDDDAFKTAYGRVGEEYKRVTFAKSLAQAHPNFEFVAPGHPLLEAVNETVLQRLAHDDGGYALFGDPQGEREGIFWFIVGEVLDGVGQAAGRRVFCLYQDARNGAVRRVNPAILWDCEPLAQATGASIDHLEALLERRAGADGHAHPQRAAQPGAVASTPPRPGARDTPGTQPDGKRAALFGGGADLARIGYFCYGLYRPRGQVERANER